MEGFKERSQKSGVEANDDYAMGESGNKTDTSSDDETNLQTTEKRKRKEHKESFSEPDNNGDQDDSHVPKKKRLIWTSEMHQKFLDAIAQIGHDSKFTFNLYHFIRIEFED